MYLYEIWSYDALFEENDIGFIESNIELSNEELKEKSIDLIKKHMKNKEIHVNEINASMLLPFNEIHTDNVNFRRKFMNIEAVHGLNSKRDFVDDCDPEYGVIIEIDEL